VSPSNKSRRRFGMVVVVVPKDRFSHDGKVGSVCGGAGLGVALALGLGLGLDDTPPFSCWSGSPMSTPFGSGFETTITNGVVEGVRAGVPNNLNVGRFLVRVVTVAVGWALLAKVATLAKRTRRMTQEFMTKFIGRIDVTPLS